MAPQIAQPLHDADERRHDWLAALGCALAGVLVFSNTIPGEFVFDDGKQIVENLLIQDPRLFWTAMTSDVWAFRGLSTEGSSLYYRPGFVFWLMANFQAFGLSAPWWHVANIVLHCWVVMAGFLVLRELGVPRPAAAAAMLVFAVHPVHVESVAWVSGSPDLLVAGTLLPALWLVLRALRDSDRRKWIGAVVLSAVAVFSKEIAIVFPAIVFVAAWFVPADPGLDSTARLRRAVTRAMPFVIAPIVYLVLRTVVLGKVGLSQGGMTMQHSLATAPAVLAFYLRQTLFPLWLGPSYPLRPITVVNVNFATVYLPLIVSAAAVFMTTRLLNRSAVQWIGLAIAGLLLLPAFNIAAFNYERIVQDRYLYIPLLGVLMFLIPPVRALAHRMAGDEARADRAVLVGALVLAVLLAFQTVRYNRAWRSDLNLWQWAVRIDPESSMNHGQLGFALLEGAKAADVPSERAARLAEAEAAMTRSIQIGPFKQALIGRGEIRIELGRFDEAEQDLRDVMRQYGPDFQAYARLAVRYERQGRLAEAEQALRTARNELPQRRCALTDMLAVVLYNQNRKEQARDELESVRAHVAAEPVPTAKMVLFHLGSLYVEIQQPAKARQAFEDYLAQTEHLSDKETLATRSAVQQALRQPGW